MSKVITDENQLNTEVDDLITEDYALEVLGLKNPADFRKFSRSFMKLSKIVKGIEDGKANKNHTHDDPEIISLDASKLKGTIDISRLPQAALERCVVVADDTARFKLTKSQVQVGDSVKVTNPDNLMYIVVDDNKLNVEAGYVAYSAAIKWDGIKDKPSTFPPAAHDHNDMYYTEAEIDSKLKEKEPAFNKNTAFNKSFGTNSNQVLEGVKLAETLGIPYGGSLNNSNTKTAGYAYYDSTTKKTYKCTVTNTLNYADASKFEAISNADLLAKFQNLLNNNSLKVDGYIYLGSLLVQWGRDKTNLSYDVWHEKKFPITFKSWSFVICTGGAKHWDSTVGYTYDLTRVRYKSFNGNSVTEFGWIAIGI